MGIAHRFLQYVTISRHTVIAAMIERHFQNKIPLKCRPVAGFRMRTQSTINTWAGKTAHVRKPNIFMDFSDALSALNRGTVH